MAAMASDVLWQLASAHQAINRAALTRYEVKADVRYEVMADVMQQSKAHLKEKVASGFMTTGIAHLLQDALSEHSLT